jgi:hypothetical protein
MPVETKVQDGSRGRQVLVRIFFVAAEAAVLTAVIVQCLCQLGYGALLSWWPNHLMFLGDSVYVFASHTEPGRDLHHTGPGLKFSQ